MQTAIAWMPMPSSAVWMVAVCIALSSLVESQGIETIPPKLYAKTLTTNINLLCRSNKPIEQCSVKVPGFIGTHDVHNLPTGLTYFGNDLNNGDCGITLATFKSSNLGKFECNVTVGGEIFRETIELLQAIPPEPTDIALGRDTILVQDGYAPNQTLTVKCISENAVPPANLTWFLDEEPIDSRLLEPIETSESIDKHGRKLITVVQKLKYFITPKDTEKQIICKASHFAIGKGFYRAYLPLNIKYAPLPIPDIYVGEGPHTVVNISLKANPYPTISWKVNGYTIPQGQSMGPYQAYVPKDMGYGDYLALLKINEQTNQTGIYEMTATNELGSQTYVIKASKYRAEDNEVDDDSTRGGAVFWVISLWTFCTSVFVSCLLNRNVFGVELL